LPGLDFDLAHQLIKDPYNFDVLTITENVKERNLERALVDWDHPLSLEAEDSG